MAAINGTSSDDNLSARSNDTISGLAGNDTLTGNGGQDTFVVRRGDGIDTITDFGGVGTGVRPAPSVIAEVDTLQFEGDGLNAEYMLLNQDGSDLRITFEDVEDTQVILKDFDLEDLENLKKSTGASVNISNILFNGQTQSQDSFDVFNANQNRDTVFNRNTVTFLNDLDNNIQGRNDSNDVINAQGGNDELEGLSGNDLLRGSGGNDTLDGGVGNDALNGGAGNDSLFSSGGNDTLDGGMGNDDLSGYYGGNDIMYGRGGNDRLIGDVSFFSSAGNSNDYIDGGAGNDSIDGGYGSDTMYGGNGDDSIYNSQDYGDGGDSLYGGAGNDDLGGSSSNDYLAGDDGNDTLEGGDDNDYLTGGNGNDNLDGGSGYWGGQDTLTGGRGADYFTFYNPAPNNFFYSPDYEIITDFSVVDDTILVSASNFDAGLTNGGAITTAQFVIGTAAGDASDRFIYNQNTGALFFDRDGTGAIGQVQFATLSTGLAMTNVDIFVI